jgi:threonine dehydratase
VFAATIPERPGSFKEFCRLLGRSNITEFNYRFADPPRRMCSSASACGTTAEKDKLLRSIERAGIRTLDLTDNELAKLHVRHLVGGPANAPNEILYRFEFPERPGASDGLSRRDEPRLEHQPLPLSQPWRRLRPHPRRIQVPPKERPAFREIRCGGSATRTSRRPGTPAAALFLGA